MKRKFIGGGNCNNLTINCEYETFDVNGVLFFQDDMGNNRACEYHEWELGELEC